MVDAVPAPTPPPPPPPPPAAAAPTTPAAATGGSQPTVSSPSSGVAPNLDTANNALPNAPQLNAPTENSSSFDASLAAQKSKTTGESNGPANAGPATKTAEIENLNAAAAQTDAAEKEAEEQIIQERAGELDAARQKVAEDKAAANLAELMTKSPTHAIQALENYIRQIDAEKGNKTETPRDPALQEVQQQSQNQKLVLTPNMSQEQMVESLENYLEQSQKPDASTSTDTNLTENKRQAEQAVEKLKQEIGEVDGLTKPQPNAALGKVMNALAKGIVPDAGVIGTTFNVGNNKILVAGLVPTGKAEKGWDASDSTLFVAVNGPNSQDVYTISPNGTVEKGTPFFPSQPLSDIVPQLKGNKVGDGTIVFANGRSGVDLDGLATPKVNVRSANGGFIRRLNSPSEQDGKKRSSMARRAVDAVVKHMMAPLNKAEKVSDAATIGGLVLSGGTGTPAAILKKIVTKAALSRAKKAAMSEVKTAIQNQIKQGLPVLAGGAWRLNGQVDLKADNQSQIQTPFGNF